MTDEEFEQRYGAKLGNFHLQCKEHPEYKGLRYPVSDCPACKDVYLNEVGKRVDAMSQSVASQLKSLRGMVTAVSDLHRQLEKEVEEFTKVAAGFDEADV